MPNRILRAGLVSSDSVDQLTAEEERLFTRLLVVVDDFGRYDARPAMVRAGAFPLKVDMSLADVAAWLSALQRARLIEFYRDDEGRVYLRVLRTDAPRAKASKFPEPTAPCGPLSAEELLCGHVQTRADTCQHVQTHVSTCLHMRSDTDAESDPSPDADASPGVRGETPPSASGGGGVSRAVVQVSSGQPAVAFEFTDPPPALPGPVAAAAQSRASPRRPKVERQHTLLADTLADAEFAPIRGDPSWVEALRDWLEHHAEKARSGYGAKGLRELLRKSMRWGSVRTLAAVKHSMGNNWTGLFEEDNARRNTTDAAGSRSGRRADGTRPGEYPEPPITLRVFRPGDAESGRSPDPLFGT